MFTTYTQEVFENNHCKDVNIVTETPEQQLIDKYNLTKCIEWINENNFKRTCLQFPNDLLNDGTSIALYLQKTFDRTFYILGDTSYGRYGFLFGHLENNFCQFN